MPGLDHAVERHDDTSPQAAARNSRRGLVLFAIYLLFYGVFVLVNAFAPEVMDRTLAEGVNLAIYAGFGLIGAAFTLALIYGWLCRDSGSAGKSVETRST